MSRVENDTPRVALAGICTRGRHTYEYRQALETTNLVLKRTSQNNAGQCDLKYMWTFRLKATRCTFQALLFGMDGWMEGVQARLGSGSVRASEAPIYGRMQRGNKPFMAIMAPPEALKSESSVRASSFRVRERCPYVGAHSLQFICGRCTGLHWFSSG